MPDLQYMYKQLSYIYIANSTSYLNAHGFYGAFSISQIVFIGGGWSGKVRGGRWGHMGSLRRIKATIQTKTAVLCL